MATRTCKVEYWRGSTLVSRPDWYVITGGPSTGKTTQIRLLTEQGYHTVPEAARLIIDEALAKGVTIEELRADEKKFQDDIAKRKMEIEATTPRDRLTFFDRGMHDTLAYLRYHTFKTEPWVAELMKISHYKKVFLLEPLERFSEDYARTEDAEFTKQIDQLFYDAYHEYGMEVIRVPDIGKTERLSYILNHL